MPRLILWPDRILKNKFSTQSNASPYWPSCGPAPVARAAAVGSGTFTFLVCLGRVSRFQLWWCITARGESGDVGSTQTLSKVINDSPPLLRVISTSASPSSMMGSLKKEEEEGVVSLQRNVTQTQRVFPSHPSSCSSVMHLSYTGPPSSLWLGKMLSCCTIMLLTRALIRGWRVTASSSLPHLTRLGPKQTARLYGCIMFSSLY